MLNGQSNLKKIQRDWDEFFTASVGIGTASQKNLYQFRVIKYCIRFIEYQLYFDTHHDGAYLAGSYLLSDIGQLWLISQAQPVGKSYLC